MVIIIIIYGLYNGNGQGSTLLMTFLTSVIVEGGTSPISHMYITWEMKLYLSRLSVSSFLLVYANLRQKLGSCLSATVLQEEEEVLVVTNGGALHVLHHEKIPYLHELFLSLIHINEFINHLSNTTKKKSKFIIQCWTCFA